MEENRTDSTDHRIDRIQNVHSGLDSRLESVALDNEAKEIIEIKHPEQKKAKEERPSILGFLSFLFIAGYIVLTIASSPTDGLSPAEARDGGVSGSITSGDLNTLP